LLPEPRPLELHTDHPAPAARSFASRAEAFEIDAETARRLPALGAWRGATLFMLQLAVVKAFLGRLTGREDLIVGTPVAGREHPDAEKLVGVFSTPLALRTRLDGDPRFVDLVERVRDTALGAYANQEYPFDRLVERLN